MKALFVNFLLLMLFFQMQSCQTQNATNKEDHSINRQWMLVEFEDFTKEQLANQHANLDLTINKDKSNYTAKMGCNSLFLSADFKKDEVSFSKIGGTMMFCKNMELEDAFVKALPKMTTYLIDGHTLILSGESGEKMKFVAADWD